jgi:hypothetical protein
VLVGGKSWDKERKEKMIYLRKKEVDEKTLEKMGIRRSYNPKEDFRFANWDCQNCIYFENNSCGGSENICEKFERIEE